MLTVADGPPLLTPDEMRAAEARAIGTGTPAGLLMERAGAGAALAIRRFTGVRAALVLCGPGNNGGDGYVVARLLRGAGFAVRIAASGPARGEPAAAMAALWDGQVEALDTADAAPLIVDALFGTGMARPLAGAVQTALDRLRGQGLVVALDIASGIDALTGAALCGPLAADLTVAFGAMKRGHAIGSGCRLSGRVVVADIGLGHIEAHVRLNPPPRLGNLGGGTHKFARGHALVIEGPPGTGGAARLTARAALRAGAGVVTLIGPEAVTPTDAVMRRTDGDGRALLADRRTTAVVIGPGLPDDARAASWLHDVLAGDKPAVIDAGALRLCAEDPAMLVGASAPLVLTPHDGEFEHLFGKPGPDRVAAARAAAARAQAVIVFKGPQTVIAAPDGRAAINTHAAPWLATAGSGDVLAGIIGGLLAQGLTPFDAARAGVWLHGDAGMRGGAGLIADDLPDLLRAVFAGL